MNRGARGAGRRAGQGAGGGRVPAPSLSPPVGPPRPRAEPPCRPLCDLGPARTLSEPRGSRRWRAAAAGGAPRRRAPGLLVGCRGRGDASSAVLGAGPHAAVLRGPCGEPRAWRASPPLRPPPPSRRAVGTSRRLALRGPAPGDPRPAAAGPRGLKGWPSRDPLIRNCGTASPARGSRALATNRGTSISLSGSWPPGIVGEPLAQAEVPLARSTTSHSVSAIY